MKKNLKKRNIGIALVVLVLAAGAGFVKYSGSLVAVEKSQVRQGPINAYLDSTGTVEAVSTAGVYSKQSGFLSHLNVGIGDVVAAGQVIGEMSSEDLYYAKTVAESRLSAAQAEYAKAKEASDSNQLKIAQSALDNANLALEQLKENYDKAKTLLTTGAISQTELNQSKVAYETGLNAQKAAEAQVSSIKKGVSSNTLKALNANVSASLAEVKRLSAANTSMVLLSPIAGVVTEKLADEGAFLTTGSKVFTVAQTDSQKVYSDVIDKDLKDIQVGQTVDFLIDEALVGSGVVSKIHPTVFSKTSELGITQKRVRVEIAVKTASQKLMLGQEIDLKYHLEAKDKVLLVDKDFVYEEGENHYVLVIEQDTLSKKAVEIGIKGDDDYEVIKGLSNGEWIVGEMEKPLDIGTKVKFETKEEKQ